LAENREFFAPPSHLAPSFWVTFRICGKGLLFLKLESSQQLTVKIWWS